MAWTLPRTWVTGENVTAAIMNTHVRNNFLETSPATAVAAGDIIYADGPNSMGGRLAKNASGILMMDPAGGGIAPVWRGAVLDDDSGTGASAGLSYSNLGTGWGFAAEITVGVETGVRALVHFSAWLSNSAAGTETYMSYAVSGATTIASSDIRGIAFRSDPAGNRAAFGNYDYPTLNAGFNIFTLQGKVGGGTGTIFRPRLFVQAN